MKNGRSSLEAVVCCSSVSPLAERKGRGWETWHSKLWCLQTHLVTPGVQKIPSLYLKTGLCDHPFPVLLRGCRVVWEFTWAQHQWEFECNSGIAESPGDSEKVITGPPASTWMAKIKSAGNTKCRHVCRAVKALSVAGGRQGWCGHSEWIVWQFLLKLNILSIQPSNPIPGCLP